VGSEADVEAGLQVGPVERAAADASQQVRRKALPAADDLGAAAVESDVGGVAPAAGGGIGGVIAVQAGRDIKGDAGQGVALLEVGG